MDNATPGDAAVRRPSLAQDAGLAALQTACMVPAWPLAFAGGYLLGLLLGTGARRPDATRPVTSSPSAWLHYYDGLTLMWGGLLLGAGAVCVLALLQRGAPTFSGRALILHHLMAAGALLLLAGQGWRPFGVRLDLASGLLLWGTAVLGARLAVRRLLEEKAR